MEKQILLPPSDAPRRKFWKPWKWIGLLIYIFALVFARILPDLFVTAANIYGIVIIAHLVFAGSRYLKNRIFWRVRNRLIGAFVFVGVIPLLVLIGLVVLTGYILFGQMAGQYLNDALQENTHQVSSINAELAGQIASADPATTFPAKAVSVASRNSKQFPRLASRLLRRMPDGALVVLAKHDPQTIIPDVSPHPGDKWLEGTASFEGILRHDSELFLASMRQIPGATEYYLETVAPLDKTVADRILREKSLYVTFVMDKGINININQSGATVIVPDRKPLTVETHAVEKNAKQSIERLEESRKSDSRRMITWFSRIIGKVYETGKGDRDEMAVLYIPWSVILKIYLGEGAGLGGFLGLIYILAGIFAFAELISLVIGFTISRRVTKSVHDIYRGILALQKGDLQHKIPVRRNDQLSLLAHSFNQMTGSISRLMEEVVEKKRLEQELEIAREVQATLFPKQLPHPPGMTVFGGCKPARVVSGDYYDFVIEDGTQLDIIVGDISGKGISAALLMANLQAAMRTQLLSSKHDNAESIGQSLAEAMTQLNQQIYQSSPPEKYATLFLSRYDVNTHRLWYCNAGHLPPIVLSSNGEQKLNATGMVVGLFPNATYEAKSVDLLPGTMLAIFTDGVTEAVNKADEEYGDQRLLEVLQQSSTRTPEEIWKHVMSQIDAWQGDLPQHDDITLIVAKAL
jgi:phosphoserine phosphatase RsbU/P